MAMRLQLGIDIEINLQFGIIIMGDHNFFTFFRCIVPEKEVGMVLSLITVYQSESKRWFFFVLYVYIFKAFQLHDVWYIPKEHEPEN